MYRYKKLALLALAGILATWGPAAGISPLSFDSMAAGYEKVDGSYRMLDGSPIEGIYARGIDVSQWQGAIDWNAVAADDVQFAMLGTRYSGTVDPRFDANATGAANAGVKVGVYIYSYATTVEMAEDEADFVLDLIKDYKISYPVAFDLEANVQSSLSKDQLAAMVNAFCSKIEAAGYYPILYANDYWLANKLDMSQIDYDVWVARYENRHIYENPVMWQVTNTGSINGISGNVDIDFQYVDLSSRLPGDLWRTINGVTYYFKDHQMIKNAWINDGSGQYYIQSDGTAFKGWREEQGKQYLLASDTGRMVTGWYKEDNNWYYLTPGSGEMAAGWQTVDGARYYLDPSSGIMKTGWLTDDSKRYYLNNSGAMVSGWRLLDNSWYYFSPENGAAATGWLKDGDSWYYLETGSLSGIGSSPVSSASSSSFGRMKTGWLTDGGKQYFLSENSGRMTTGWRLWNNDWYYFGGDGAMLGGKIDVNGVSYYLDPSSGKMAANTTLTIDGVNYTADESGALSQVVETAAEGANEEGTGDTPQAETGSQTQTSGQPAQGPGRTAADEPE